MENEVPRIIIADDHPFLRRGLRLTIEAESDIKVVAEADNGETALAMICEHEPDVVLLDVDMPGKDGFEVAGAIRERNLAVDVIFLTMHNSESLFNAALDLGVKGYVVKESAMTEILDCIQAVLAGRNYISPQLSTYLINRASRVVALANNKPGLKDLTPSEQNILRMIADEKTSQQIADGLFISVRTVDRHRSNICLKLNLHGSNALVKFAVAHRSELS
jgi:DNA-binding NarL/FixJ family response regulator